MLAFVVNALICEVEALLRSPRMPRVVPDQREKFENDELFRKLSRESEVGLLRVNVFAIRKWAYHIITDCYVRLGLSCLSIRSSFSALRGFLSAYAYLGANEYNPTMGDLD